ncbi:hypothetical protein LYSIN_02787 [Lysinibacillus sphaericus]|uniref:Uncharacterized protein n=1 Tax=Lysinibacillus sphaericus TaxID=1421 RepID=A0A2S5D4M8_LYSSH|nr:hypothetical protein [Lysinibacillus sphaericus]POZ58003.1 hypothetical protein LYSIN_02787 [Lysinibacillus sphaericus]
MINTEWFSIRALTLPATAIALLLAFFIVWLILRIQFPKIWSGVYGDAIFTYILVWKFSLIITDFQSVINQPLALLYFNGGTVGVLLGVAAILLQFWRKRQQLQFDNEGIMASGWAIMLTQSIYQWFVVLLNDNPLQSELITLVVLSVLTIFILWKVPTTKTALYLYTVGYSIVAALQPLGFWQPAVGVSFLLLLLGIGIQRMGGKE